ncbi:MAG: hypothetical protein HY897_25915 [Deltaproteobacteria bacterium]|nr:hypothetical protein [Deltaproteobacteria bacterium]
MSKQSSSLALDVLGLALWIMFIGLPLLLWWAAKLFFRLLRLLWRSPQLFSKDIRCVNGHKNPAIGSWKCSCGAVFSGWAFAPCPVCGRSADYVDGCEICGASLLNPLR